MYLDFFRLREYPFQLTPDPDFLYLSSGHARAWSYLDFSVWNREGFVVVTGDPGCGKTLLVRYLLSKLGEETNIARLFQTQLDDKEFLQAVLLEFGFELFNAGKVELLDALNSFLIDGFLAGKRTLLVIDDAQVLSRRALEELRLLSELEAQKERILRVALVGRPQLSAKLSSPAMGQLAQSVRLQCHLGPLSEAETAEYIRYRTRAAGAQSEEVFAGEFVPTIYRYTGGVPRSINILCDTALIVAFSEGINRVDNNVLEMAIQELGWATAVEGATQRERLAVEALENGSAQ